MHRVTVAWSGQHSLFGLFCFFERPVYSDKLTRPGIFRFLLQVRKHIHVFPGLFYRPLFILHFGHAVMITQAKSLVNESVRNGSGIPSLVPSYFNFVGQQTEPPASAADPASSLVSRGIQGDDI